jgi:hypothetical protein
MVALGEKRLQWAHPNKSLKPLMEWLSGCMVLTKLKADRTRLNSRVMLLI